MSSESIYGVDTVHMTLADMEVDELHLLKGDTLSWHGQSTVEGTRGTKTLNTRQAANGISLEQVSSSTTCDHS